MWETCLQLLERRGYTIRCWLNEDYIADSWQAAKDGFDLWAASPVALLGLASIHEEVCPQEHKAYWWQERDDRSKNVYERCREQADAEELRQTQWRDTPAWQAKIRRVWEEYEHDVDTTADCLGLPLRLTRPLLQDMGLLDNPLGRLSTREKQAYAGLCLARYCHASHIQHSAVDQLVDHLLSVLVSEDLPEWERHGAGLALSGRGDSVPDELAQVLDEETRPAFEELVEYAVEVGIGDMYGADTESPLSDLMRCVWVLHHAAVSLPDIPASFGQQPKPGWGERLDLVDLEDVKKG